MFRARALGRLVPRQQTLRAFRTCRPVLAHKEAHLAHEYDATVEPAKVIKQSEGQRKFEEFVYTNIMQRSPVFGFFIVCGAVVLEYCNDLLWDGIWNITNSGYFYEDMIKNHPGLARDTGGSDEEEEEEE
eukprot:gb/GEZN01007537.1/.p1 GENE.gb/GEZN01007537.1/~~gb/GEZN01007537.1/.p1  ORF type:complete len:146 (+),score=36.33 gb/GEZN01007537.1/:50-439(+)